MNKKGQGVQFNWIFIVIAGVFVLMFFLGFLVKYMDIQDSKQNAQYGWDFKNHILGLKSTEQYSNFSAPRFKIDYDCENMIINDDQEFSMPYSVFMEEIDSGEILFWVEEYNKGFLVDRVVFISDASKKYYFDEEYRSNIPPNIRLVTSASNADVVVSSDPLKVADKKDRKEVFVDNGVIRFIDDDKSFSYDDDFFIYGAAFSSSEIFKCTQDDLEERFDILSGLYISKISYLSPSQSASCTPLYDTLRSALVVSLTAAEIKSSNNNLINYGCEVVF